MFEIPEKFLDNYANVLTAKEFKVLIFVAYMNHKYSHFGNTLDNLAKMCGLSYDKTKKILDNLVYNDFVFSYYSTEGRLYFIKDIE